MEHTVVWYDADGFRCEKDDAVKGVIEEYEDGELRFSTTFYLEKGEQAEQ